MAVYERTYVPYDGPRTPQWSRFLVLPRYAYREVFDSRIFLAFYLACFLVPIGVALLIYVPHNLKFLETFGLPAEIVTEFFGYDGAFFLAWFVAPEGTLSFVLALVVGPALVSNDLNNNGLPLYLSRPFTRTEYVLGKMAVLALLLSTITWVPGLLLFGLQASLGGGAWLREHWTLAPALFLGSWIWILVLCLLSLALSAYLRWRPLVRAAMFGVLFVAGGAATLVNVMFDTTWGSLLNVLEMIEVVWVWMFGISTRTPVPVWAAWTALLALCGGCVLLLARKVRAYEVVR